MMTSKMSRELDKSLVENAIRDKWHTVDEICEITHLGGYKIRTILKKSDVITFRKRRKHGIVNGFNVIEYRIKADISFYIILYDTVKN